MQRESGLSGRILVALNKIDGVKAVKIRSGEVGTPDICGCKRGKSFWLETKLPKGKSEERIQNYRLNKWKEAGSTVGVVRSVEEAVRIVKGI